MLSIFSVEIGVNMFDPSKRTAYSITITIYRYKRKSALLISHLATMMKVSPSYIVPSVNSEALIVVIVLKGTQISCFCLHFAHLYDVTIHCALTIDHFNDFRYWLCLL